MTATAGVAHGTLRQLDRRARGRPAYGLSGGSRKAGIQYSEHLEGDGAAIFAQACKLGFEGIVSKHREHAYRSGPSKAWLKTKNPAAPGVTRFEDRLPGA